MSEVASVMVSPDVNLELCMIDEMVCLIRSIADKASGQNMQNWFAHIQMATTITTETALKNI